MSIQQAELVDQVCEGDRGALSEILMSRRAELERRIRRRMGPKVREVFDTDDVFSTVMARLDIYFARGRQDIHGAEQLWKLFHRVLDRALADKGRIASKMRRCVFDTDHVPDAETTPSAEQAEEIIRRAMAAIDDPTNRQLVWLRVVGECEHSEIRDILGLKSSMASRLRWMRIKEQLRGVLEDA